MSPRSLIVLAIVAPVLGVGAAWSASKIFRAPDSDIAPLYNCGSAKGWYAVMQQDGPVAYWVCARGK